MTRCTTIVAAFGAVSVFLFCGEWQETSAQTPAQLEYERQQRESSRQQEQQRQEQQRQQQIMQENARRQQEELTRSIRANMPSSSTPSVPSVESPSTRSATGSSSPSATSEDPRKMWERQPTLAANRNPLLGVWTHLGAKNKAACELFFGVKTTGALRVEFRPTTIVSILIGGREQVLAEAQYRGNDKQIAVLPRSKMQGGIDLIVVGFDAPDRARLFNSECKMLRTDDVAGGPARRAAWVLMEAYSAPK